MDNGCIHDSLLCAPGWGRATRTAASPRLTAASGEEGQRRDLLRRQLGKIEVSGPIAPETARPVDRAAVADMDESLGIDDEVAAEAQWLVGRRLAPAPPTRYRRSPNSTTRCSSAMFISLGDGGGAPPIR